MSKTPRIDRIEEAVASQIKLSYIDAPNTTVQNRAQMVDLSADGRPRMGIERVMIQDMVQLSSESGPNGESVYKPANDSMNQVRSIGNWAVSVSAFGGAHIFGQDTGDSIEISFYGTGLNILGSNANTGSVDVRASVDGAAFGPNLIAQLANTLEGRNYADNQVRPIVSGLSQGLHTIKLEMFNSGNWDVNGFEVLNESSDVKVPAFSSSARDYPATSLPYNSGFESGTLGTKGGRVLIYAKDDKTVKHAAQATDATALYLATADHSNEEVIAKHNFREFGAGRGDDFSTIAGSTSDRAFTLDDGTTTLVGDGINVESGSYGLRTALAGDFWVLTFVGTGLDLIAQSNVAGATDEQEVFIDGVSRGVVTPIAGANLQVRKICSGLPYGTHTIKFQRNILSVASFLLFDIVVYGPKKPALPAGAIELGEYFVMADYVANTSTDILKQGQGTLNKTATREVAYSGSASLGGVGAAERNGFEVTNGATTSMSYSFFGTGVEFRSSGDGSMSLDVTLDDGSGPLALNSTNFPTAVASDHGSLTMNLSTAKITGSGVTAGSGAGVSGLPLKHYTIKFDDAVGVQDRFNGLDIITPIHAPKLNGPFVKQNTLRVGSESVRDLRVLHSQKPYVFSTGIGNSDSTTSATIAPMEFANGAFVAKKAGKYKLRWEGRLHQSSSTLEGQIQLFLNGKMVRAMRLLVANTSTAMPYPAVEYVVNLPAGEHFANVMWKTSGGTLNVDNLADFGQNFTIEQLD